MDKYTEKFINRIDKIIILDDQNETVVVLTTSDMVCPFEKGEFIEYLNEQHIDKRMVFEKCEILHMNDSDFED